MVIDQNSLSAHSAGVSVQRPKVGAGPVKWVLLAATVGLSFALPVIGSLIGYIPSRISNSLESNAEHDSIAKHFSEEIGMRIGKPPEAVTRDDLYEVAARDAGFNQLLQGVHEQKASADRGSLVGAGAGAVLHGVGMVVGSLAADVGVSALFKKDELYVLDVSDHIEEKLAAGEPVTAEDVFMLRVAQNDELALRIEQENGKKFQKLDENKRAQIMQAMPGLFDAAQNDAAALNARTIKTQQLAVQTAPDQQKWAHRVGRQPRAANFRAQVEASRAQAVAPKLGA